jgi:hypothetical protein
MRIRLWLTLLTLLIIAGFIAYNISYSEPSNSDKSGEDAENKVEIDDMERGATHSVGDEAELGEFDDLKNITVDGLVGRCPHWAESFAQKYKSECGYWLDRFDKWESVVSKESKEAAYFCESEESCRGWGDRLGGIVNAFVKALHNNYQFKIGHEGLNSLFHPCLFQKNRWTNWASSTRSFRPKADSCVVTPAVQCGGWLAMSCRGQAVVTKNTDRTCLPQSDCNHLLEMYPDRLSAVNVVGCLMRAIFEPRDKFYTETMFPVRIGKDTKKKMSLYEIEQFMRDYYVISIHFRLGDAYAFFNQAASEMSLKKEKYSRPFRCAQTIESYLATKSNKGEDGDTGDDTELRINGKPVMWFVASDSYRIKQLALHAFPNKIITLDIKPEHVALKTQDDTLERTIAEWYLLGLGDELVVNKIGTTLGDFYHGRISAFPKTSWVYHLKHMAYDAGRCVRFTLPYEGIWEDLKTKSCNEGPFRHFRTNFTQDHLDPLKNSGVEFPLAYVANGKVITTNEKLDEPQPTEDEEGGA